VKGRRCGAIRRVLVGFRADLLELARQLNCHRLPIDRIRASLREDIDPTAVLRSVIVFSPSC